jgi:hypothetical protein
VAVGLVVLVRERGVGNAVVGVCVDAMFAFFAFGVAAGFFFDGAFFDAADEVAGGFFDAAFFDEGAAVDGPADEVEGGAAGAAGAACVVDVLDVEPDEAEAPTDEADGGAADARS